MPAEKCEVCGRSKRNGICEPCRIVIGERELIEMTEDRNRLNGEIAEVKHENERLREFIGRIKGPCLPQHLEDEADAILEEALAASGSRVCPFCAGKGDIEGQDPCDMCDATGRVAREKNDDI